MGRLGEHVEGETGGLVMINLAREATRWSEDQTGESLSSESRLGRYSSFWGERDLRWRMACSKASGEARHLGQREGRSWLNQEGWAAR